MQLEECYEMIGGNYQDVKGRIQSDALIRRFVIKFPSDDSYQLLCEAMEKEDYEMGFRAAHTLKGLSMNLGFKKLSTSSSELTELMRNSKEQDIDAPKCREVFAQVCEDYEGVLAAIKKLESDEN